MPILILYSSEKGSTGEIANRISSRIAEQLPPTEVHNIHDFDASRLDDYTAIVLGSCIHNMHWLPEAKAFLTANKNALISKPLFAFSVGAAGSMPKFVRAQSMKSEEKKMAHDVQKALDKKVKLHALFNGKVEKKDEPWLMRCCCGMLGGLTYGDLREWEKVDAWADEVVKDLKGSAEEH
ncbi:flavo protein [Trematosphaeria pertusa]|uniref:Flavo protein n=1 Tax=Trematosphaeria pertusa TaxID=390896 RepID=A0A6A6ISA7_9PLEO|nr:flavo protein [Trematosphaeria pertusa]KAF2253371.1 flavo protein [Trematosphaeria pertusa]